MPAMLFGQSALNAFQLSQNNELRGTARFVSMAGAFGALGGDLSTLTQNRPDWACTPAAKSEHRST